MSAAQHAWEKMLDAALRVPSLAPPGGEDLALRAMSCALHGRCYTPVHACGVELLSDFSKGDSSFAVAAGMLGAWWQEVCAGRPYFQSTWRPLLRTSFAVTI